METKKINESYYKSVIRRYMTGHLGENLEEYCRSHRVSYSKFMTVLERDDAMFQTYLQSRKSEAEELPLCRLSIDGAPSGQDRLEEVTITIGGAVVRIGGCTSPSLSDLLNRLEVCHA